LKRILIFIVSLVARGLVVICTFINTRLIIELVGVEGFAGFTIVLSLAPWFALLNCGLPNTVQNKISHARATGHDAYYFQQATVNSVYSVGWIYLLPVIGVSVFIKQVLLGQHGSMPYLAVLVVVIGLCSAGLGAIFQQVLHATHRSIWPTLAPAAQLLLTTFLLYLLRSLKISSELYVSLAVALPMLLIFFGGGWLAGAKFHRKINWQPLKILLHQSKGFLFFGIAGNVAISCDYIVMAQLLNSFEIVEYNLVTKAFGTILTLHVVWLAASWTPMSDFFHNKNYKALRRMLVRLLRLGFGIALFFGLLLSFVINPFAKIFTADKITHLPTELIALGLVYVLVRVWSDTFATALLSCSKVKTVNSYIVIQSIISVTAQWLLGQYYGATGILLGIIISFLFTAAWILPLQFFKLINNTDHLLPHYEI
jgi:O-antigen/teichoic acid export membrane protein